MDETARRVEYLFRPPSLARARRRRPRRAPRPAARDTGYTAHRCTPARISASGAAARRRSYIATVPSPAPTVTRCAFADGSDEGSFAAFGASATPSAKTLGAPTHHPPHAHDHAGAPSAMARRRGHVEIHQRKSVSQRRHERHRRTGRQRGCATAAEPNVARRAAPGRERHPRAHVRRAKAHLGQVAALRHRGDARVDVVRGRGFDSGPSLRDESTAERFFVRRSARSSRSRASRSRRRSACEGVSSIPSRFGSNMRSTVRWVVSSGSPRVSRAGLRFSPTDGRRTSNAVGWAGPSPVWSSATLAARDSAFAAAYLAALVASSAAARSRTASARSFSTLRRRWESERFASASRVSRALALELGAGLVELRGVDEGVERVDEELANVRRLGLDVALRALAAVAALLAVEPLEDARVAEAVAARQARDLVRASIAVGSRQMLHARASPGCREATTVVERPAGGPSRRATPRERRRPSSCRVHHVIERDDGVVGTRARRVRRSVPRNARRTERRRRHRRAVSRVRDAHAPARRDARLVASESSKRASERGEAGRRRADKKFQRSVRLCQN